VVVCRPGNSQTGPLLRDCPLRSEETGAVKVLILLKQVIIGDPEELLALEMFFNSRWMDTYPVVSKLMVQFLHPLRCPLLGAVTPGTTPFFLSPWVSDCVSKVLPL
jgi:hypothetical protein